MGSAEAEGIPPSRVVMSRASCEILGPIRSTVGVVVSQATLKGAVRAGEWGRETGSAPEASRTPGRFCELFPQGLSQDG